MSLKPSLEEKLRLAIKHFWNTRETQLQRQGAKTGQRGGAVTGGAQMNGFIALVKDLLCQNGLPTAHVH